MSLKALNCTPILSIGMMMINFVRGPANSIYTQYIFKILCQVAKIQRVLYDFLLNPVIMRHLSFAQAKT